MNATPKVQCRKNQAGPLQHRGELCEQALQYLDRAHQLCRRASWPPSHGAVAAGFEAAPVKASQVPTTGRCIFVVLVLLEFEVRCLSGETELQLRHFVDAASCQEAVGLKSLLAMSKIAGSTSSRRLAIHCLQRYLRAFIGVRGGVDYWQCAAAYREMIGLHASRNESFAVYDGILHLLSGGGSGGPSDKDGVAGSAQLYPPEEVAWLVATAWNNGVHFYRLQQYTWSERWMGKSLALSKFCSADAFPHETMMESYAECLKRCGE